MILSIIAEKNSMGVTQLAQEIGVDKSTISRLLSTLKYHDFVQVDRSTQKYRLGFRILHLGEAIKENINVIGIARPIIAELCKNLNEGVHLCAFNNNSVYVVDQVKSKKVYNLSATVGMIEPIHCSSVGKCILAFKRPQTIDALLENYEFTKYTEKTITNKEDLLKELEKIRQQGYAIDDEEMSIGVRCIAAPIYNYRGSVQYSIGVSGQSTNISVSNIGSYINKIVEVAKQISMEMGANHY
jgi:DNA-binding IclR family transcriptional regulator